MSIDVLSKVMTAFLHRLPTQCPKTRVQDRLRFLEEREVKLNALRRALIEGEESGFVEYSLDGLFKELDKEGKS